MGPPKFSKCDADAQPPHNDFQADKYSYSGNTVTARGVSGIQQAIMAGGPMEVAFTVYSDFENYAGGIYHHVSGMPVGGHAVKVVGWGVENGVNYWKIATPGIHTGGRKATSESSSARAESMIRPWHRTPQQSGAERVMPLESWWCELFGGDAVKRRCCQEEMLSRGDVWDLSSSIHCGPSVFELFREI